MKNHPLDRLALQVHRSGYYQSVRARMKLSTQSKLAWAVLVLLVTIKLSIAPQPYKSTTREYVYVSAGDPNGLSLANSDPATFRIKSRIDLSLKPDIIP